MKDGLDWNLVLTKPKGCNLEVDQIHFIANGEEFFRSTHLNPVLGFRGTSAARVLHLDDSQPLPDAIHAVWSTAEEPDEKFYLRLQLPKIQLLKLYADNYKMQQGKWGNDYPQGQLTLTLGLAPNGFASLWFGDLNTETEGFVMEIASYKATDSTTVLLKEAYLDTLYGIATHRFAAPAFQPSAPGRVVRLYCEYANGAAEVIHEPRGRRSVMDVINRQRGWPLVKRVQTQFYIDSVSGFRAHYALDFSRFPVQEFAQGSDGTSFIYRLDRTDTVSQLTRRPDGAIVVPLKFVSEEPL